MITARTCKIKYFLHLEVNVDPFIGEIRLSALNFAPRGWAFCDGSLMPVQNNAALYALLGTTFGGTAGVSFALPDLRGRTAVHMGTNPVSNTQYPFAKKLGVESVSLTNTQVPSHSHVLNVSDAPGTKTSISTNINVLATEIGSPTSPALPIYANAKNLIPMAATMCKPQGGSAAHNNMQQSLVLNYIIAIVGIFPQRD
ncbi:phage tail protein [Undibacterium sp. B2R-29]|nr:phage tail protein [Undibacterium crateris]